MRNLLINSCIAALMITTAACEKDKYKSKGDLLLTGVVYQADTVNMLPHVPLRGSTVYLSKGSDTANYLFFTTTDSSGRYSFLSVDCSTTYTAFTRFFKDGFVYRGSSEVSPAGCSGTISKDIYVYPRFTNGMALYFQDDQGTPISGLRFRLYLSRTAAQFDSVAHAFADTVARADARYAQLEIGAGRYYVVAQKQLGPITRILFDSVDIQADKLTRKTFRLQ